MASFQQNNIKSLIASFATVAFMLVAIPQVASAQTGRISDLLNRKSTLSEEIQKNRQIAEQKKAEAADLNGQVTELQGQIDEAQGRIDQTQGHINTVQQEIDNLKQEIIDKQAKLLDEQQKLNAALVEIYDASHQSTWQIILSTSTLSEAINQTKYLEALQAQISRSIDEITRIKNELEAKKAEQEKKQAELVNLQREQELYQQGIESQQAQKNLLLKDAQSAQSVAEEKIAQAQKEYANVNSELYRLQEMARNRAASRPPGSKVVTNIAWEWPLGGPLTTYFNGSTPFQPNGGHTGIDIANVYGSPVSAAAKGTVTTAGSGLGYGNYVVINHGEGYVSLYAHFSDFAVSPGQQVEAGDVIGFVGMTGWTTGPHLHFEIRQGGVPDDPLAYLP